MGEEGGEGTFFSAPPGLAARGHLTRGSRTATAAAATQSAVGPASSRLLRGFCACSCVAGGGGHGRRRRRRWGLLTATATGSPNRFYRRRRSTTRSVADCHRRLRPRLPTPPPNAAPTRVYCHRRCWCSHATWRPFSLCARPTPLPPPPPPALSRCRRLGWSGRPHRLRGRPLPLFHLPLCRPLSAVDVPLF